MASNRYNFTGTNGNNSFTMQSSILSAWISYSLSRQLSTEGLISMENITSSIGSASGTYPKLGASLHLFF